MEQTLFLLRELDKSEKGVKAIKLGNLPRALVQEFYLKFEVKEDKDALEIFKKDLVNYAYTVRDKVRENETVMTQIANNTREQAMLGDFPQAAYNAILDSSGAHENQKLQLLTDKAKAHAFFGVLFDLIKEAG